MKINKYVNSINTIYCKSRSYLISFHSFRESKITPFGYTYSIVDWIGYSNYYDSSIGIDLDHSIIGNK
jgi:hypothetical protein